jgi:hypothetical protein
MISSSDCGSSTSACASATCSEDHHDRVLNDFVLEGGNAQRTLSPIGFRDVDSLRRLRAIRPSVQATM